MYGTHDVQAANADDGRCRQTCSLSWRRDFEARPKCHTYAREPKPGLDWLTDTTQVADRSHRSVTAGVSALPPSFRGTASPKPLPDVWAAAVLLCRRSHVAGTRVEHGTSRPCAREGGRPLPNMPIGSTIISRMLSEYGLQARRLGAGFSPADRWPGKERLHWIAFLG